jgi:hypothetical protein
MMSALPPTADMKKHQIDFRYGPDADLGPRLLGLFIPASGRCRGTAACPFGATTDMADLTRLPSRHGTSSVSEIARPRAFAVLGSIISSNSVVYKTRRHSFGLFSGAAAIYFRSSDVRPYCSDYGVGTQRL